MKINRGNLLPEQLWEADTWTNGLPSSSSPIKVHEPATGGSRADRAGRTIGRD